jgi:hypothetical protein
LGFDENEALLVGGTIEVDILDGTIETHLEPESELLLAQLVDLD